MALDLSVTDEVRRQAAQTPSWNWRRQGFAAVCLAAAWSVAISVPAADEGETVSPEGRSHPGLVTDRASWMQDNLDLLRGEIVRYHPASPEVLCQHRVRPASEEQREQRRAYLLAGF